MKISGKITKIIYNKDNFYIFTINNTKVSMDFYTDLNIEVGKYVEVEGTFVENKYGRTCKAVSIMEISSTPSRNLLPIYISGIGEKKAIEIKEVLGESYIEELKNNPLVIYDFYLPTKSKELISQWNDLKENMSRFNRDDLPKYISKNMKGIGIKKATQWVETIPDKLSENILNKEIVIKYLASDTSNNIYEQVKNIANVEKTHKELIELGYPEFFVIKLIEKYKGDTFSKIISNPYLPVIDGMSFKDCDKIAIEKLEFDEESIHRIIYGVIDVLKDNESLGNTFMLKEEAINKSCSLLNIDDFEFIESMINMNLSYNLDSQFVELNGKLYRRVIYYTEKKMARTLKEKVLYSKNEISQKTIKFINNSFLTEEQKEAIIGLLTNKVAILNGGPGTGKTTSVKLLCQAIQMENKTFSLASPTGRASKRLSESTGFEAKTLHRLLEYKPRGIIGKFMKNEDYPINSDYVIIDESSMLDVFMMNNLLKAIKPETTLIFIGDVDQLPSISMGSLLKDMRDSEVIPVYTLSQIHRQGKDSYIIKNANNIKNNQKLELIKGSDFSFKKVDSFNNAYDFIKMCISKGKEFQLLTPVKNGVLGTHSLNELMQVSLNSSSANKKEIFAYDKLFREGDKVIQLENDYNKEVYNGEMGIIEKIKNEIVTVYYPDNVPNRIEYKKKDLKGLDLSYCISIHKSQGSEFNNVIMVIDEKNKNFLSKELIYTGVTRSKHGFVLLSNLCEDSFSNLKTSNNRATSLNEFLKIV